MKMEVGLWIDDSEAVVMILRDEGEEMRRITSCRAEQVFLSFGVQVIPVKPIQNGRPVFNRLAQYYDEIVSSISEADSILILGTDEARAGLEKRLVTGMFADRLVGVETVRRMSYRQLAITVRRYFRRKAEIECLTLSMPAS